MLPRHISDYRTLFWAFGLFPLVPALAYAAPGALPALVPLAIYLAYCAGVLTHNHTHVPVFRARWANDVYGMWLSVFYGCPIAFWIPTHHHNHHRFLNGPEDVTRTNRRSDVHDARQALAYTLACAGWQRPLISRYVRRAHAVRGRRWREVRNQGAALVGAHAALLALGVGMQGLGAGLLTYALSFGVPALIAPLLMMFTNYVQHVDCDPTSAHDHSRNFTSPFVNWFVFDAGYHTVHHEHPARHWSDYGALHRARAGRIDPRLNERSVLEFCLEKYWLAPLGAVLGARRSARQ